MKTTIDKTIILVEVGVPSYIIEAFDEEQMEKK